MTLDSILKNLDPVISSTLDRALSNKEISVDQTTELLDADGTEMNMILIVAYAFDCSNLKLLLQMC